MLDLRGSHDASLTLTLLSLQGIVNREEPRIYLVLDSYSEFWLEYALSKVPIQVTRIDSSSDLITRFRSSLSGLVVYDPLIPDTINVATTIAGLDNRLIVDPASLPSLQQMLAITDVVDLRQNVRNLGWSNTPDGRVSIYQWVYDNLWTRCDHRMIGVANPGPPVSEYPTKLGARDYIVALRLVTLYLSARDADQKALFQRFLADAPSPIPIFGWVEGEEDATVSLVSEYGDWTPVFTHVEKATSPADLTVLSGIDVQPTRYRPRIDNQTILRITEPGVYLAAYVTDGDNIGSYDYTLGGNNWNFYGSSDVPLGWTINPTLIDIAPLIWNYYVSSASSQVSLVAGPSGVGYMSPKDMTPSQLEKYLDYARNYWDATGLRTVQVLGWKDEAAPMYSERLTPLGVFTGYTGRLSRNMMPFPLGTPSETFFHFPFGTITPIAPNAYGYSFSSTDLNDADITNNIMNILEGRDPPQMLYATSDLFGNGAVVYDPTSTSGEVRVVYANQESGETYLVFGPYATLPAGEYQATFRVKISDQKSSGPVAVLDIATHLGEAGKILKSQSLSTTDFTSGTWQEFKINFELQTTTANMEFRIKFVSGSADLYADTISLLKMDGWKLYDRSQPLFLTIVLIVAAGNKTAPPRTGIELLRKLSKMDPRVHLISTDEFFAAINPKYMQSLVNGILGQLDPGRMPEGTSTKIRDADNLLSNGEYGDYISLTRSIIRDTTAKLRIESNPSNAGILTQAASDYVYPRGAAVTISQTPVAGYDFAGWILDGRELGANTTIRIQMDSDHNLTALYRSSTGRSTSTTTTGPSPPVPGFPVESTLAGLLCGVAALAVLRRKRSGFRRLRPVRPSSIPRSNRPSDPLLLTFAGTPAIVIPSSRNDRLTT